MAENQTSNPKNPAYCWNCGASNATDTGVVRVNYRRYGSNAARPLCTECAHVTNWVSNLFLIIGLAVVLVISLGYIITEWNYY